MHKITGQFEKPGPYFSRSRSNLQDPLKWLPQGVCMPDRWNIGSMAKETQTGSTESLAQQAVAEHAAQESHDIDWEDATVMDVQQQYHQRCLLESWHIRSELNNE